MILINSRPVLFGIPVKYLESTFILNAQMKHFPSKSVIRIQTMGARRDRCNIDDSKNLGEG